MEQVFNSNNKITWQVFHQQLRIIVCAVSVCWVFYTLITSAAPHLSEQGDRWPQYFENNTSKLWLLLVLTLLHHCRRVKELSALSNTDVHGSCVWAGRPAWLLLKPAQEAGKTRWCQLSSVTALIAVEATSVGARKVCTAVVQFLMLCDSKTALWTGSSLLINYPHT